MKDFKEESMDMARQALANLRKSAEGAAQIARQEFQARIEAIRDYAESDEFERDLDRLAQRLKLDSREYMELPKQGKARYLFEHARKQILRSAETGGAFALISRKSRVVMAITLISGGIKGAEILFECYQVFIPAVRRRGLHVV